MATRRAPVANDADVAALLGLDPLPDAGSDQASDPQMQAAQVGRHVRAARRRAGLTSAALAAQIGLTPDKLSKIESGRRRVSPRELPPLARALGVPIAALLGVRPERSSALALAHRVAAGATASATSATRARAREILQAEARLEQAGALPPRQLSAAGAEVAEVIAARHAGKPRTSQEAQRQGRLLAEQVRRALDLGSAEIGDLPALIEMHFAADVALSPLGEGSDGLCAHAGEAALLVVNTDYPLGRTRFTLAHELGHHLLRDPREVIDEQQSDMNASTFGERRVNAFAGHLLLPIKAVSTTLDWLNVDRDDLAAATAAARAALGYLMVLYGVSLPCTLQQLVESGVMSVPVKRELADSLRPSELVRAARRLIQAGPGPEQTLREQRPPARLVSAALEAARSGVVGTHSVAVLLDRPDDDALFDEVMFGDPALVP